MNATNRNPYAPPQSDPGWAFAARSMTSLDPPVVFSGALTEDDLRTYLRLEGNLGLFVPLMLIICFGFVGLVLFMQGGAFAAVAVGLLGILLIAIIVSTVPYRRSLLVSSNPQCLSSVAGELRVDGIHFHREESATFVRWDWFGDAMVSERIVAFLPATQPDQPQLIAHHMIQNLGDWDRVLSAAVTPPSEESGERLRQRNLALLRDANRERTREVTSGAIRFSGAVYSEDFTRLASDQRRGQRSLRAKVVRGSLLACGALILAGTANIFFERVAFIAGFAIIYALLAAVGIAVRLKRRGAGRSIVYFMHAYATQSSVVIDYALTVTEIQWPALRVAVRNDSTMVLSRRNSIQVIFVRREMFQGETDWQQFCNLVAQKLDHSL